MKNIIGDNIRRIRKSRGLTMMELADELARIGHICTEKAVGAWERGERTPSPLTIKALCTVLKCPIYAVFYLDDEEAIRQQERLLNADRLDEKAQQSLEYIKTEWQGRTAPLIEADKAYTLLSKKRRYRIIKVLIEELDDAGKHGELIGYVPCDIELLTKCWNELLDEEEKT